jgi:hypothetical protein
MGGGRELSWKILAIGRSTLAGLIALLLPFTLFVGFRQLEIVLSTFRFTDSTPILLISSGHMLARIMNPLTHTIDFILIRVRFAVRTRDDSHTYLS